MWQARKTHPGEEKHSPATFFSSYKSPKLYEVQLLTLKQKRG
jgi:hypothetical protein